MEIAIWIAGLIAIVVSFVTNLLTKWWDKKKQAQVLIEMGEAIGAFGGWMKNLGHKAEDEKITPEEVQDQALEWKNVWKEFKDVWDAIKK